MDIDRALDALLGKLGSLGQLGETERRLLKQLPMTIESFVTDADVVRYGDLVQHCALVIEGWVCRYKLLEKGRQIVSVHVPGDLPDLQGLYLPLIDHGFATLTPATIAFIPHAPIKQAMLEHPGLLAAFWRTALIDSATFREWVASLGRRTAIQRIAHLFCEIYVRTKAIGLAPASSCPLPLRQADLADATGLSTVHVNRSLQDLRKAGLVELRSGRLTIRDWPRLVATAEFDPAYLGAPTITA